ncbi:hypothetical protein PFFVO_01540 [Plasmodium falciparum Vietnam Oak-Knoll (FVO)]|uniref:Uncharacterized protein n=1 Tax=Plasmodium falciparum Vietnam Oak-Knoll (FVO) TaxID=1036723 RepID=A0A024VBP5_PLAFA|nr:hypothetical protein PFFVO_01540 [Plasmodium falciparum Vietnam Oak-Knoll (FVO)]
MVYNISQFSSTFKKFVFIDELFVCFNLKVRYIYTYEKVFSYSLSLYCFFLYYNFINHLLIILFQKIKINVTKHFNNLTTYSFEICDLWILFFFPNGQYNISLKKMCINND